MRGAAGWTIFQPVEGELCKRFARWRAARRVRAFFFNARTHDDGEKVVLGKIPAGRIKDGDGARHTYASSVNG
jgi:uncharacterized protein (DUF1800 family)